MSKFAVLLHLSCTQCSTALFGIPVLHQNHFRRALLLLKNYHLEVTVAVEMHSVRHKSKFICWVTAKLTSFIRYTCTDKLLLIAYIVVCALEYCLLQGYIILCVKLLYNASVYKLFVLRKSVSTNFIVTGITRLTAHNRLYASNI